MFMRFAQDKSDLLTKFSRPSYGHYRVLEKRNRSADVVINVYHPSMVRSAYTNPVSVTSPMTSQLDTTGMGESREARGDLKSELNNSSTADNPPTVCCGERLTDGQGSDTTALSISKSCQNRFIENNDTLIEGDLTGESNQEDRDVARMSLRVT